VTFQLPLLLLLHVGPFFKGVIGGCCKKSLAREVKTWEGGKSILESGQLPPPPPPPPPRVD
jgi:hypothetical protein